MSPLSLEDEVRSEFLPSAQPEPIQFRLTLAEVRYGCRLGWSFAGSFILHAVVIFCLFFLSFTISRVRPTELVQVIDFNDRTQVIYLPVLGGGAEGNGHPGGLSGIPLKTSAPAAARGTKGFSHPGSQPILSDQPNPVSQKQTLLQPGLKDLPILQRFTPLPNIVQATNAEPALDVRANKPSLTPRLPVTPLIQPPKLKLPAALPDLRTADPDLPVLEAAVTPEEKPKLTLPEPVQPLKVSKQRLEKSSAPVAPPKLEQVAPSSTRGPDLQNLVALSTMPAPPQGSPQIPKGETRGRFSVSPQAESPQSEPGSKAQGSLPTSGVGIGSQADAPAGNKVDELVVGAGNGTGGVTPSGGGGLGAGAGNGKGWGKGGNGTIGGRGSESGVGLGTGSGITSGSGTGAGSGRGAGSFPGITIQGGSLSGGGTAGKPRSGDPVSPQTSYGMTVVSTASSGGGLPDLGVFSSEKVYSVYLDMRKNTLDQIPSWTLQYAPLRSAEEAGSRRLETVTPPYLMVKEIPKLPVELARKYQRRMIIVYAILDTQGRLDNILVMQSPAVQITDLILEALNKWIFRPAELNGQPVSIKLLLGVPVSLSE